MKNLFPLYEGGSILHFAPRGGGIFADKGQFPILRNPRSANPALAVRRSRVKTVSATWTLLVLAGRAIAAVADWLDRQTVRGQVREIETYLSKATDHADLEHRMRQVEHRNFSTLF